MLIRSHKPLQRYMYFQSGPAETPHAPDARQLRRPPAGLRFLPMVPPDGASLTASLRF